MTVESYEADVRPMSLDERGRLLYEPRWAQRRIKNPPQFILAMSFIFIGIVSIIPVTNLMENGPVTDTVLGVFWVCLNIWFGVFLIALEMVQMPFRVYENGVTEVGVSFSEGLGRRNRLVHRTMIQSVGLTRTTRSLIWGNYISVTYSRPGRSDKTLLLTSSVVDDKVEAVRALHRIVPNRFDRTLDHFVEKHDI